ncbi:MAG: substrate-binding periplasmic protein, partial [Janthinobacterium lividum]
PLADKRDYTGAEDLKGKKAGAQIGTRYLDAYKNTNVFSDVAAYDSVPDIMRDVANGRLDVGVGDFPILAYTMQQGRFPQVRLVTSYKPIVVGPVNIAVRQGNADLLSKINASLAKMKVDGRLDTILKKWGL